MSLEQELSAIWAKYEPQRKTWSDMERLKSEAYADLAALNHKMSMAGLPSVGFETQAPPMYYMKQQQGLANMNQMLANMNQMPANMNQMPAPKTWREEMDAELLSSIRRHFE